MQKDKEIAFDREEHPDVLLQLFQACESCPIPKFQEAIREMRCKHNRRDPQITKEFLMAEALSSYDKLALEKNGLLKIQSQSLLHHLCQMHLP